MTKRRLSAIKKAFKKQRTRFKKMGVADIKCPSPRAKTVQVRLKGQKKFKRIKI